VLILENTNSNISEEVHPRIETHIPLRSKPLLGTCSEPWLGKRGHSPGGGGRPVVGHKAHLQGHLLVGLRFPGG